MKLTQHKKIQWNYLAIAFAIPFVGMLFVMLLGGSEPFGGKSLLYSDAWHQYYPFFKAYRKALLSGDSMLYTWAIGMGLDYLGLISYYLASPLNLLSVLVPESLLLEFFSLLTPVRLGLAGLFFAIFLKKMFGKDDISIAVFGALYALCAWIMGYQWNVMWLDTFALLPLVALGTVSLLRDKKFILYTLALFQSVYSNYYIGFFVCIFVFLVFVCYQICNFTTIKRFFQDLARIALFSILALGMTMILELPAFAALQTTQSSVNNFPTGFKLNIADENTWAGLLDAMRQVAGQMGGGIEPSFKEGLPNLYCGVGTLVLALLFLMNGEVKLREKLCTVGLLVLFILSFIVRQLDYIWHGFHFTNMIPYRFSFLYSFVLLYMAYRAWNLRSRFEAWQVLLAVILAAMLFACSESLSTTVTLDLGDFELMNTLGLGDISWEIPVYVIFNGAFLILYLVTILFGMVEKQIPQNATKRQISRIEAERERRRVLSRNLVCGVVILEITMNLLNFLGWYSFTTVTNYPKGTDYTESMITYMHEREEGKDFFRAEMTHTQTLNDDALNGYNGISAFTSSANVRVTEFMKALGYGAKNTYNRYCFEESSPVANLFLNLKYMIDRDDKDKSSTYFTDLHSYGGVHLLKNNTYLPLGFLAESELADVDFGENTGAFAFQNKLFTAATGVENEVWSRIQGTITASDVNLTESNNSGYCVYEDCVSGSRVYYTYMADRDGFLCIHLNLPKRNDFYVTVNGTQLYKETISLPQMLAVGDVTAGDEIVIEMVCDAGESGTMTVSAAILDNELFLQGYEVLAASTLDITSFSNTRVEGTIECDRDGLLYTSIPQNGNWSVEVDGQTAEIALVGDAMIGVELTEGTHTVTFTYRNTAFTWGCVITLVCAAIFVLLIWRVYKPELKLQGKFQK